MHLKSSLIKIRESIYLRMAVFWTVLTLYLSLASAKTLSDINVWNIVGLDKLGHMVFYALLVFLWCMACGRNSKWKIYFVIFLTISFGILMEIFQLYMSKGRSFEFNDVIANTFGVFMGFILFKNLIN